MPSAEFFSFTPSYAGASSLNGYRLIPRGVDMTSSQSKSPVLIYVYGSAILCGHHLNVISGEPA